MLGIYKCLFDHPLFPDTLFLLECQYISIVKNELIVYHTVQYEPLALIIGTLALNLVDSCDKTSASRFW